MRTLLVAEYAPPFDGRTQPAIDEVRRLRNAGQQVEVLSPAPSAAHHHADLEALGGALRLLRLVRRFDRVVVARALADAPALRLALRGARVVDWWDETPPRATTEHPTEQVTAKAWPMAGAEAVMREVETRASVRRRAGELRRAGARSSEPLRCIPPLALPSEQSARAAAALGKRLVRRLTAWEIDPLIAHVNQLREAMIDSLDQRPSNDGAG